MLNHKNTKKMNTIIIIEKKQIQKKQKETQRKIKFNCEEKKALEAANQIIKMLECGGTYDRIKINEKIKIMEDAYMNMKYYNNINKKNGGKNEKIKN